MNNNEMLEVVNEQDEVIGLENRTKIHKEGLLHREVHIWFFTPRGEIIFQHRAKNKDTYPDRLDASVGGHVEPGMSYEETAVKECREETGIDIDSSELIFLTKSAERSIDTTTGLINNTIRAQYAYTHTQPIEALVVEEGEILGFEVWSVEILPRLAEEDKERFIPFILSDETLTLFETARKKLSI
ncbi:MAG: NUDIX domain-containing protein [Candidatus Campbellbacteria bacterium]|nr:NUDIX domain-containing protein [Candidatus Campbellbacteria bacterium]